MPRENDIIEKYCRKSILDMSELNEWQQAAIVLLATKRDHKMTYDQISDELGIDSSTLYRFRQRNDVKDYILRYNMARIVDKIPEVMEAQVESAISNRSTKAAELLLKYAGLLIERRSVDADVRAEVTSVGDQDTDALKAELESLRSKLGGV